MARRIFHILTEAEPFSSFHGGALSRWVAGTLADDEDSFVVCAESDGSWGFPEERIRCLPELGGYRRWNKVQAFPLPWPIRRAMLRKILSEGLQDLRAGDVVWVMNRLHFAAALAQHVAKRGAHLVLHMHNSHLAKATGKMPYGLAPAMTAFCSRFLETEARKRIANLGATAVIPNGADDSLFFPAADTEFGRNGTIPEVLFVGRLVPEKGAHVLIEAMRKLHERGVSAVARIVGSAAFGNNHATGYVEELHRNAPPNVEFLGYGDPLRLGEHFRNADIFCCPSTWDEPFGMINVEAMATRIPVVATRCGGIPEIFSEGGALLVPPSSAGELAEALEKLIGDPALRNRLAQEGYTSFRRNFTWAAVHRHYRNIIEALPA